MATLGIWIENEKIAAWVKPSHRIKIIIIIHIIRNHFKPNQYTFIEQILNEYECMKI